MIRRFLIAAALLSLAPACGDKQNLQKINAPDGGVTLAYDFTPGQVYRGHVAHSETVRGTSGGSLSRGFTFDVTLSIQGRSPDGAGTLVTARYSAVDIRWGLPTGSPISASEIVGKAKDQLSGLEVDFSVDDAGKILSMPELPEDMGAELRFLVQEAIDTLETAFLSVPARPLKPGDTWKDQKTRGRQGKLGRYLDTVTTTTVEGFYRAAAANDAEVTRLKIDETETEVVTAKTGAHEVKKEKQTEALFAHGKKYLVSLNREATTFDPGNATIFTSLKVNWTKESALAEVGPAAPPTRQTQAIEDPCHPDYVGGEECQTGAAPTEPAPPAGPAGEATPNKPPAG